MRRARCRERLHVGFRQFRDGRPRAVEHSGRRARHDQPARAERCRQVRGEDVGIDVQQRAVGCDPDAGDDRDVAELQQVGQQRRRLRRRARRRDLNRRALHLSLRAAPPSWPGRFLRRRRSGPRRGRRVRQSRRPGRCWSARRAPTPRCRARRCRSRAGRRRTAGSGRGPSGPRRSPGRRHGRRPAARASRGGQSPRRTPRRRSRPRAARRRVSGPSPRQFNPVASGNP